MMDDKSTAPQSAAASPQMLAHYAEHFSPPSQRSWYELGAQSKVENITKLCDNAPHDSILDIGAGDGAVLHRLDAVGFGSQLHAVEISISGLKALRERTWRSLVSAEPFDGAALPFRDASFDLAILSHVVEHVEHPRILLREAARVARRVYVEVPLEYTLTYRRLRRDFVFDATGHINFFTPILIRLLVQSSGLTVLQQHVRHVPIEAYRCVKGRRGWFNYAVKEGALRLNPRLATQLFVYHGCLVCTSDSRNASSEAGPR